MTSYEATADGFVVGIGSSSTNLKNGLRIINFGLVYCGTYYNNGADYAENIDRIGLFVFIEDSKIKLAESSDDNIIGAVSGGTCSIIGDADVVVEAKWCGNVDAKLDLILQLQVEVHKLADTVSTFDGRIVTLENSVKACHRRLDDLGNINSKVHLNKH